MASAILILGLLVWMLVLRPKNTIASLVPEHASWYIEVDRPMDILKGVTRGIRLFADPSLTLFAEWQNELGYIKNLFQAEPSVASYIQANTLGISAHVLQGKEAGYLFYLPVPRADHDRVFEMIRKVYGQSGKYRYEERQYMNRRIGEITFKQGSKAVSFTISNSDDALFGSFSGFLVEEVVRKSGLLFKPNFVEGLKKDVRYAGVAGKPLRMFINLSRAADFLYQYFNQNMTGLRLTGNLGQSMVFGFEAPNGTTWTSQGYLHQDGDQQKNQRQALSEEVRQYLPLSSSVSLQWAGPQAWNLLPGKAKRDVNTPDTLGKALDPQILMAHLEGLGLRKYDRILIGRVADARQLELWLQSNLGKESQRLEPYKENIGNTVLFQHPNPFVAQHLGGKTMADWVPLFYCFDNEYFLASDDVETLKQALYRKKTNPKIQTETMPKSVYWEIKPPMCLPMIMDGATGVLQKNLNQWIGIIRSVASVSIKDNGEEENPGLTLTVELKIPSSSSNGQWEEKERVFLDSNARTGPIRLDWEEGDRHFWAIQDIKLNTSIFGPDLQKQFSVPEGSAWINRPSILENGTNESYSVFFATSGAMYAITSKGNSMPHFPLSLPDSGYTLEHARSIDYDHTHQYRFAATNRYGAVYFADMQGRYLHGWNPWVNAVPMQMAPRHVRIGEKDVIIMLDRNGKLMMTNRKGEMFAGFPVQLHGRTDQPVFVEKGLTFRDSYIYVLSDLGQVEKVNFEGKATSSIQLLRPDKDTRFQFCLDQREKTFVIARISGNSVAVFDQSYRLVFNAKTLSEDVIVQYFHFGASNRIFAVTDTKNAQSQLFDEAGIQLNPSPIETDQPIDIVRDPAEAGRFELVKCFKNKLSKIAFERD